MASPRRALRLGGTWLLAASVVAALFVAGSVGANADGPTVTGAGSTWVQIALDQWRADIARYGYSINYQGDGSSAGRSLYISGGVDFAASEIPFQSDEIARMGGVIHYQYLPDVAGGTSLMYNLHTPSGSRITSLNLNADAAGKIFTGGITSWHDPEIAALNPGLQIRENRMIPVIRSDGSGTSAQFSLYLQDQAPGIWNAFSAAQGCPAPCSQWPDFTGSFHAAYSDGVANFVASDAQGQGAITYVEAGYAYGREFPVANLFNASGHYTQPVSDNVATALTHATLYSDLTQNLTNVYRAPEANAYAMSSYSYMIIPCVIPSSQVSTCSTNAPPNFGASKGFVLGTWIIYIACAGQREAAPLGYSPLPANLIQADFDAVNRLPGHPTTPPIDYQHCPNPNLYRAGGGTTSAPPSQSSGATGAGSQSAPPQDAASTVPGDSAVDPNSLTNSTVLPAGVTRVSVLDSAARQKLLDDAMAVAARTQAPSRTPLWFAALILLLLVFVPMLTATVRWRRSKRG